MCPPSCLALPATLAALVLAIAPSLAAADADPPSDYLLTQDVYFPFQPRVAKPLAASLQATVARSKQASYPLKVALVAGEPDLGAIPNLFNKPDEYAPFLARELPISSMPTLVVMPEGLAVANATPAAAKAIEDIEVDKDEKANGLARAAIEAVPKLATASGHPVPATKLPPGAAKDDGGTSPLIVFGAPVALVALAALVVGLRRRRADDRDEDDEVTPAGTETGGGS